MAAAACRRLEPRPWLGAAGALAGAAAELAVVDTDREPAASRFRRRPSRDRDRGSGDCCRAVPWLGEGHPARELVAVRYGEVGDNSTALPWAIVAVGAAAALCAVLPQSAAAACALTLGLSTLAIGGFWTVELMRAVNGDQGLASIGLGPFVAAAGSVTLIIGGGMAISGR
jgi:hypothetical protein